MIFYTGLHQPSDAKHFDRACISIRRLVGYRERRLPIAAQLIIDSGAFSELLLHGRHRFSVREYADHLRRLHYDGVARIDAAVTQDFMCEPFMLEKTGLSLLDHQQQTVERYDALMDEQLPFLVMPVLQGYAPSEYLQHLAAYGFRLPLGAWVGVGSVCKRNGTPGEVLAVLSAIHGARPDLRLHGFGLKKTALKVPAITDLLYSADSMAWSYHARRNGLNRNGWQVAKQFQSDIISSSAP